MEVFVLSAAAHHGCAFYDPPEDDDQKIDERNAEHQECRGHFAARVDGEHAEQQSVEHGAAVSHEYLRRREIEEESARGDACEQKAHESEFRLADARRALRWGGIR